MDTHQYIQIVLVLAVLSVPESTVCMSSEEKNEMREKVLEMFNHAYRNYMDHAYPADELMPLSCKGRYRGTEPSRGDIDDTLGNFSLTLIDTLDTLVVLGLLEEFEHAVIQVIDEVNFDQDIVVSVFETNIRVLGGLLGGHVMARYLKSRKKGMEWYSDELLEKAKDIGYRLLPAFNTTTGMPYPRVNLRYGVKHDRSRTGGEKDTCTACAGTMILEFSALSRLSGDPIFEDRAHRAMEYLWQSRHRSSDLVGTVINIHNGDWIRRDSGVGAGIDSYYEYVLKAYILLGDETYLDRFNKHYAGIRKYITQGPMLVDVHMHKPFTNSRNFMDALLAFWPGLLTLIGDMKPAIETHEMLYQVIQRHNFLPEAFTTDFRIHWAQHPLRPEFLESTYYLYKATGDAHYLDVGQEVLDNLNAHARVKCGFAAIKDVTAGTHEDQMDSYVLAETFKYLYLLFSEPSDMVLDIDQFIFTTEAHLLPLSLSIHNNTSNGTKMPEIDSIFEDDDKYYERTCPNTNRVYDNNYVKSFRDPLKNMVDSSCPLSQSRCTAPVVRPPFVKGSASSSACKPKRAGNINIKEKLAVGSNKIQIGTKPGESIEIEVKLSNRHRLKAAEFVAGNKVQLETLRKMGISVVTMEDGRVQLLHTAAEAASAEEAEDGMLFMQEMIELSKNQVNVAQHEPRVVQFMTPPYLGLEVLSAGPAQFGHDLKADGSIKGKLVMADPGRACQSLNNVEAVRGRIAIVERGDCMFVDKARQLQQAGAIAGLILDTQVGTSSTKQQMFAMSGDGKTDITIPLLFMYHEEGQQLLEAHHKHADLQVYLSYQPKRSEEVMRDLLADRLQTKQAPYPDTPHSSDVPVDRPNTYFSQSDERYTKSVPLVSEPAVSSKQESDSYLQTITGPGNSKRIRLQLDKVKPIKGNLGAVLEKLVSQLIKYTNFQFLESNEKYLIAITKMLDAISENNYNLIDANALNVLQKLNHVLKPKEVGETEREPETQSGTTSSFKERLNKEMDTMLDEYISAELKKIVTDASSFVEESEDSDSTKPNDNNAKLDSYATQEELENYYGIVKPGGRFEKGGGDVKRYLPPNVKQAPDWLSLEQGQVIIAKDGNIYADLKDSYWDWAREKEGEVLGAESSDEEHLFQLNSRENVKSQESIQEERNTDDLGDSAQFAQNGGNPKIRDQKQSDSSIREENSEHLSMETEESDERTSDESISRDEL